MVTEDLNAVLAQQRERCGEQFQGDPEIGVMLFPGIERSNVSSAAMWFRNQMVSKSDDGKMQAWFVACITYRDQFKYLYHSRYIYRLMDPTSNHAERFYPTPGTMVGGVFQPYRGGSDSGVAPPSK
jgi:hypothetical protein